MSVILSDAYSPVCDGVIDAYSQLSLWYWLQTAQSVMVSLMHTANYVCDTVWCIQPSLCWCHWCIQPTKSVILAGDSPVCDGVIDAYSQISLILSVIHAPNLWWCHGCIKPSKFVILSDACNPICDGVTDAYSQLYMWYCLMHTAQSELVSLMHKAK
jgi:hypothetical protein